MTKLHFDKSFQVQRERELFHLSVGYIAKQLDVPANFYISQECGLAPFTDEQIAILENVFLTSLKM